jgi:hypothetical protein
MYAAALPAGTKDPPDRSLQPLMGIRDHQLDPAQTTPGQALQKARPEGFGLRPTDVQPNDLASASLFAATAIIAAPETMRPRSRRIGETGDIGQCALETEAKAGVRHRAAAGRSRYQA